MLAYDPTEIMKVVRQRPFEVIGDNTRVDFGISPHLMPPLIHIGFRIRKSDSDIHAPANLFVGELLD
ncbi:hypothetical protein AXK57_01690 [Tsukamurella pulmonis]|nr:hypothetical protein AXK57_01690 [Tsukamurella pulmonis]RDH09887.1 hypothetical protein DVB88_20190 [Tsukamurella pulmonis]